MDKGGSVVRSKAGKRGSLAYITGSSRRGLFLIMLSATNPAHFHNNGVVRACVCGDGWPDWTDSTLCFGGRNTCKRALTTNTHRLARAQFPALSIHENRRVRKSMSVRQHNWEREREGRHSQAKKPKEHVRTKAIEEMRILSNRLRCRVARGGQCLFRIL